MVWSLFHNRPHHHAIHCCSQVHHSFQCSKNYLRKFCWSSSKLKSFHVFKWNIMRFLSQKGPKKDLHLQIIQNNFVQGSQNDCWEQCICTCHLTTRSKRCFLFHFAHSLEALHFPYLLDLFLTWYFCHNWSLHLKRVKFPSNLSVSGIL